MFCGFDDICCNNIRAIPLTPTPTPLSITTLLATTSLDSDIKTVLTFINSNTTVKNQVNANQPVLTSFNNLNNKLNSLTSEKNTLNNTINTLTSEKNTLVKNATDLNKIYTDIKNINTDISTNVKSFTDNNSKLDSTYKNLTNTISKLDITSINLDNIIINSFINNLSFETLDDKLIILEHNKEILNMVDISKFLIKVIGKENSFVFSKTDKNIIINTNNKYDINDKFELYYGDVKISTLNLYRTVKSLDKEPNKSSVKITLLDNINCLTNLNIDLYPKNILNVSFTISPSENIIKTDKNTISTDVKPTDVSINIENSFIQNDVFYCSSDKLNYCSNNRIIPLNLKLDSSSSNIIPQN